MLGNKVGLSRGCAGAYTVLGLSALGLEFRESRLELRD